MEKINEVKLPLILAREFMHNVGFIEREMQMRAQNLFVTANNYPLPFAMHLPLQPASLGRIDSLSKEGHFIMHSISFPEPLMASALQNSLSIFPEPYLKKYMLSQKISLRESPFHKS